MMSSAGKKLARSNVLFFYYLVLLYHVFRFLAPADKSKQYEYLTDRICIFFKLSLYFFIANFSAMQFIIL